MLKRKQKLIEYWESTKLIKNKSVIAAFKKVKRELFVLEDYKSEAYEDYPLPILKGQTISQPTTVMIMLDALEVKQGMKVLEIGAGSGYNAAMLSALVGSKGKVFTTEIVPELVDFAKSNIKKAGIRNVTVIKSDGSQGYKQDAPYDRIICTAAAPKIPEVLVDQLKEKGVLLIPVGPHYGQHMIRATKVKGELLTEDLGEFMFVPLKGKFGMS